MDSHRCRPGLAGAVFLGLLAGIGPFGTPDASAGAEHTLYMAVSLTKDFTIGRKAMNESGLFRTADREAIEHIGFHHPRVDAVAVDPRDQDVLYLAALNGVLRTEDGGQSWRILTGWKMTEPKDVAVDPHHPDRVFAALPDGIGVSENRGQTWTYKDEGIARKYTQTLVVDRSVSDRLLAGTELGIYLSEDGAQSWQQVLPTEATVSRIIQSPHDPAVFFAATQNDGAWRSDDAGATWQQLDGVPHEYTLHHIAVDPANPENIAVGGWGIGLLVSEDGGQSWEPRNQGLPSTELWSFAFDPDKPGRLYANPYQEALYVSDDLGRSWEPFFFEGAQVWDYVFVPTTTTSER